MPCSAIGWLDSLSVQFPELQTALPGCCAAPATELNADPVVPTAFPQWAAVLDGWGAKLLGAVSTAAEMLARGFGLEPEAFTQRMALGPHLLAPTGGHVAGSGTGRWCQEGCLPAKKAAALGASPLVCTVLPPAPVPTDCAAARCLLLTRRRL